MRNVTGLVSMAFIWVAVISFSGCGNKATDGPMESAAAPLDAPIETQVALDSADDSASASPIEVAGGEVPPPLFRAPAADEADQAVEPSRSELVDRLVRALHREAADNPSPMRELVMIAALSIIEPQPALDPDLMDRLNSSDRRMLSKLQEFFAQLGESLASPGGGEQWLEQAVARLQGPSPHSRELKLANAALCTRVVGFGDYTPFERAAFIAGSPQKVIIYLEIENFSSEANQRGEYATELSQQVAISSDRDGAVIVKEPWQGAVDVSRKKRRDFFTVQTLTLPNSLAPGAYRLQVQVRDEQTGQETHTSIAFEIVDDPKQAVMVK